MLVFGEYSRLCTGIWPSVKHDFSACWLGRSKVADYFGLTGCSKDPDCCLKKATGPGFGRSLGNLCPSFEKPMVHDWSLEISGEKVK